MKRSLIAAMVMLTPLWVNAQIKDTGGPQPTPARLYALCAAAATTRSNNTSDPSVFGTALKRTDQSGQEIPWYGAILHEQSISVPAESWLFLRRVEAHSLGTGVFEALCPFARTDLPPALVTYMVTTRANPKQRRPAGFWILSGRASTATVEFVPGTDSLKARRVAERRLMEAAGGRVEHSGGGVWVVEGTAASIPWFKE